MLWRTSTPSHPYPTNDSGLAEQAILCSRPERTVDEERMFENESISVATEDEDWELVSGAEETSLDTTSSAETLTTTTAQNQFAKSELLAGGDPASDPNKAENNGAPCDTSFIEEESPHDPACQRQCRSSYNNRPCETNENRGANTFSESLFFQSIRAKDEAFACSQLEYGLDPDVTDEWGPALTQALRVGLKSLTRLLLAKGADPNAKDVWGLVLTQAIRADKDLASRLLQKGACPNAKDTWGPALTQAIRAKDEKLAIELLQMGACPDAEDTWGPALTQAVRARYERLAVMLVEYGANRNVTDTWGSVLSQSMRYNLRILVAILLKAGVLP